MGGQYAQRIASFAKDRFWGREFSPRYALDFRVKQYRIHTAAQEEDWAKVRDLRAEVFSDSFSNENLGFLVEFDDVDLASDFLMVSDAESGELLGTYRLLLSTYAETFYSESEFQMEAFLKLPGIKLELSRASIKKKARHGSVIGLLWRGISLYAEFSKADFLFGLSSMDNLGPLELARVYRDLRHGGYIDLRLGISPKPSENIIDLSAYCQSVEEYNGPSVPIPSLLKSYLKAGAKICSYPVKDQVFGCIDFLTILSWGSMAGNYQKRFT